MNWSYEVPLRTWEKSAVESQASTTITTTCVSHIPVYANDANEKGEMPAKKKGKKKGKGGSKGETEGDEGGGKAEPTGKEQELRRELVY